MSSISMELRPGVAPSLRVHWERVVTVLLSFALLAAVVLALATRGSGVAAGDAAARPAGDGAVLADQLAPALVEHTVVPGDTLWAIATGIDPTTDPRPMVDRIMRLNNLTSGEVALGEVLLVPSRP